MSAKLSEPSLFRAWDPKKKVIYEVLQWNHPDYKPTICVLNGQSGEVSYRRIGEVKLLRYSYQRDSYNIPIYENDMISITLFTGEMKTVSVIFLRGILGVSDGDNFYPIDALQHFIPGITAISIIGNLSESPVINSMKSDQGRSN